MPIYEYQCQSCKHEFEALQKVSDATLVDCPDCGKPELRKKVSAAAFRLKGGGWYETDFKSSGQKNLAGDAGTSGDKGSDAGKSGDKGADAGKSASKDAGKDSGKVSGNSNNAPAAG